MSDKKYQICGTLYENCPVTKENEKLRAENKRLRNHLIYVKEWLDKERRDPDWLKDPQVTFYELQLYVEQALSGQKGGDYE